jgi:hypothetical protein
MAYKTFVAGEEALAADVNSYLMSQAVARFASAAARTAGLPAPILNQLTALDTVPGVIDYWTGSVWAPATPGAELTSAQITASVAITNLAIGSAQLVVGTPARVYDALPIVVEFSSANVLTPAAASASIHLVLTDGTTPVAEIAVLAGVSQISAPVLARVRLTPTAASHTYQIFAFVSPSGPGQVNAGTGTSGSYSPAAIRITRA